MTRRKTMYKKTLCALLIILGLFLSGNAFAGTKFINKDTAKNRKPVTYGTSNNKSDIVIKSDRNSNIMSTKPKEKKEKENQSVGPIFVVPEIKP